MYAHIKMHLNGVMCDSLLFQCFSHHDYHWTTQSDYNGKRLQKNHQISHPAAHAIEGVLLVPLRS